MKRTKKILMACANDWASPFQVGSHHLARSFVKAGYEVAFVSDAVSPFHLAAGWSERLAERFKNHNEGGISDLGGKLWAYVPYSFFTPHRWPLLNTSWTHRNWWRYTRPNVVDVIRARGFGEVDLLYFDSVLPAFWLSEIKSLFSVMRVADRFSGFRRTVPATLTQLKDIAGRVDAVVYSAKSLEKDIASLKPRRRVHVPNGVNFAHFARGSMTLPPEYRNIRKPIALYVGAMDVWFDFKLVQEAAERYPNVSFVLVGPDALARQELKPRPNLHLLGSKPFQDLPPYLHNADLGLIPFDVEGHPGLVNGVNPLKLYEYMACGLPVVSVEWEELRHIKSPAILCRGREAFLKAVPRALALRKSRSKRVSYASDKDWSRSAEKILRLIP